MSESEEKRKKELEEAKKILGEENKKEMEACGKEIQEVLEKHGFEMKVTPSQIFLTKR